MPEPTKIPLQHFSRGYDTQMEAYEDMRPFLEQHEIVSAEIYQTESGLYVYTLRYFYK